MKSKIKNLFYSKIKKLKLFYAKTKKSVLEFCSEHESVLKYCFLQIPMFVIGYGLALSIPAHYLFHIPFGKATILSFGLAFYFIKEELPRIVNKMRSKK